MNVNIFKMPFYIQKGFLELLRNTHQVSTPGGYSEFRVTGMIEWGQKSKPKKIPRASNKTQKNPWTKN